VLVHELAHVRQQTGGAVSMLPQENLALEIDPDPKLEEEAEEVAQRVMSGGELGIQRMQDAEVHVQRLDVEKGKKIIAKYRQALLEKTELDPEQIEQIEEEIGLNVADTDASGEEMHDVLNFKLLEQAETVLENVKNEINEMADMKDEEEWLEQTRSHHSHMRKGMDEDTYQEVTDEKQMDRLEDREDELESRKEEIRPVLERADAELQRLLGTDNIRLTDEQETAVKNALADITGSAFTNAILTYLVGGDFDTTLVDAWLEYINDADGGAVIGTAVAVTAAWKTFKSVCKRLVGSDEENVEDIIDIEETGEETEEVDY